MKDRDTPPLDRYLLGRLPEEEADRLEQRLLHDGRLFELAEAAEDDLIDRYVRGELSAGDETRFERHLLPSERVRDRVSVARALAALPKAGREAASAPRSDSAVPFSHRRTRFAWAAALVATLAAGALALEVARLHEVVETGGADSRAVVRPLQPPAPSPRAPEEPAVVAEDSVNPPSAEGEEPVDRLDPSAAEPASGERIAELERELDAARARLAEVTARPAEPAGTTATLFLALATRGADEEPTLDLGDEERVELQLDLGRRRPAGTVGAVVSAGGVVVWRQPRVEVVTIEGEAMARLLLPRESLVRGRYRVELEDLKEDGLLGSYTFAVR